MTDLLQSILLVIIFIAVPFWLIHKMDKRATQKGALFTGPATREMRVLAIVLGVVFAGLFIMEIIASSTIHLLFPILALALIGYGLGADPQLRKLQRREQNTLSPINPIVSNESDGDFGEQNKLEKLLKNRFVRLGATITIVLVISLIPLSLAVWASNHPNNPFSWVVVIGLIIFVVLARVLKWFKFLRNLFK